MCAFVENSNIQIGIPPEENEKSQQFLKFLDFFSKLWSIVLVKLHQGVIANPGAESSNCTISRRLAMLNSAKTTKKQEKGCKKMKKLIAILLSLLLVLGCFAGCAKTETPPEEAPAAETPEEPEAPAEGEDATPEETPDAESSGEQAALPLVSEGEEATITIGLPQLALTEDYETNDYTLWLEEQTGIDLEFVYFSNDQTEQVTQLNAMIAGGDELPDILWNLEGVDPSLMYELGEDGYILDLTDYFEQYGNYFWVAYNMVDASQKDQIFQYGKDPSNGALYAFPRFQESQVDACNTLVTINQNWLDAVGAEVPTTVDELYEVLKKFATEDPNGNGKSDEIPLAGIYNEYRSNITEWIINAFVYCNDDVFVNATDGEIWSPYTTDEYRQALIYMNKLYSEGLMSPLTFSMTQNSEMAALCTPADGEALVGVAGGHPMLTFSQDDDNMYEYAPIGPLSAATDLGGYAAWYGHTYQYCTFITEDAEDPVLAFKLLDFMCSQESVFRMRYGEEGVHWVRAEEGAVGALGTPATITVIDSSAYGGQNNVNWHAVGSVCVPLALMTTSYEEDGSWSSIRDGRLCYDERKLYDAAQQKDEIIYKIIYTSEENELVSSVLQQLKDYVDEARALFVSGVMDPNKDADWETYLSNLSAQGLDDYLDVTQTAYARMTGE